ncbi:hypothetical protein SDC9_201371 [bioreactor metagenome]|uniref:Uncharacterized protein n=1 Tax=bioreactor metagenome TaxID=1076179 RepID=A0A645IQR1_9ZZZZ
MFGTASGNSYSKLPRRPAAYTASPSFFQLPVADANPGDVLELTFPIKTEEKHETVRGKELTVLWRGPDVVDILPHGDHVRLYQRDLSVPKCYPTPDEVVYTGAANYGPTQQSSRK